MYIESVSATTYRGWQEPLYVHVCMTGRIPEHLIATYSLLCLLCKTTLKYYQMETL